MKRNGQDGGTRYVLSALASPETKVGTKVKVTQSLPGFAAVRLVRRSFTV